MILETGLKMSFKQLGVLGFALFFLLQLRLLLALPHHHQRSLLAVADHLNQEKDVSSIIESKILAVSVKVKVKLWDNDHETKGVARYGGGHSSVGGSHGNGGGYVAAGDNGGGGGNDQGQGGAAVIPVYAAGATHHNRDHRHHGSSAGTLYRIGSSCLALILLTSFLIVY